MDFIILCKVTPLTNRGAWTRFPPSCIFWINNKDIFFANQFIFLGYFCLQAGNLWPLVQTVNAYMEPFFHFLHDYASTQYLYAEIIFFSRPTRTVFLPVKPSSLLGTGMSLWDPTALGSLFYYSSWLEPDLLSLNFGFTYYHLTLYML